jgi:hypothetical protein
MAGPRATAGCRGGGLRNRRIALASSSRYQRPVEPQDDEVVQEHSDALLLRRRSARLSDVFDEVSRYGQNRDRVLPEREDYEGTLDGIPIGNNFLAPAVFVRDSEVCSHVNITFRLGSALADSVSAWPGCEVGIRVVLASAPSAAYVGVFA